jgi:hypothetical protein
MDDKAREAFEARCSSHINCSRKDSGEYVDVFTEGEWQEFKDGWTAALQWAASQQAAEGWMLVPKEPTPEMLARAAISVLRPADRDMELASHVVLTHPAAPHGISADLIAASIATMAPAYRAMIAAAPPATQGGADEQR